MKYPEGWAQQRVRHELTFRDKNNIVRVVVAHGRRADDGVGARTSPACRASTSRAARSA